MNFALLRQMLRRSRTRMILVAIGALLWGMLAPVLYVSVLAETSKLAQLPTAMTHFGSGNIASLVGTITVFYEHPFLIAILATVSVGMTAPAIAGARQRGTLEMWLARPISRQAVVITATLAVMIALAVVLAALVAGTVLGAALEGRSSEVSIAELPAVWLNALLLYMAFATVGIAASTMNNRSAPAMGIGIAFLLVNYLVEVLAPIWEPIRPYQNLSLINHFQPGSIFAAGPRFADLAILGIAVALPLAYAIFSFPRRDLPAPE